MPWWIYLLGVIYVVPIIRLFVQVGLFGLNLARWLRLSHHPTTTHAKDAKWSRINLTLGMCEYYVRPARNTVLGTVLLVSIGYQLIKFYFLTSIDTNFSTVTYLIAFLALTLYSGHQQLALILRGVDFLKSHPHIHPQFFFNVIYHLHGPLPYEGPEVGSNDLVFPESISFLRHVRSRQTYLPLIMAVWDTTFFAHCCLRVLKYSGKNYLKEIFDPLASMWGKRVLQLIQGSLNVTGCNHLDGLKGKVLLILNHKSQLDFAITFFVLSHVKLSSGRGIRPRFITAREHFVDNPLIYEVMGVGKSIEAVDMVSIDRRKSARGISDLKTAAQYLVKGEIDIAVFPQGTRAEGNIDRSEKRRDAGYYTTVSPRDIDSDLGHLRKGTAFLAVDSLVELARSNGEALHLVFIGINGTATAMPKQSFKIQTETEIRYRISPPLTLSPDRALGIKKPQSAKAQDEEEKAYLDLVGELSREIDKQLVNSLEIHQNLSYRFLLDLKGYFRYSEDRIKMIETNFELMAKQSSVPYQILDRIYACPLEDWNPYLSEMAQLLMDGSPLERLKTLRSHVSHRMLECLKKKIHGQRAKKMLVPNPSIK